ncbi:hypothetical protein [Kitasatospora purpeofusca]|nr:hypothetical protein [Kitasatospora purpeofusca]MCX4755159.1 hypothetical protein [Kitasatospora purpeofusca]WSR36952.1 hypothetical protein OG715_41905 [Kitasatospora purpeofusca]
MPGWNGGDACTWAVGPGDGGTDLWTVLADGTGSPALLAAAALAPAVVG